MTRFLCYLALSATLVPLQAVGTGCDDQPAGSRRAGSTESEDVASQPPPARTRNLLLITLDTTRADALGCYGAATATPHLDRLAARGTLFEQAHTVAPVTLPAHTTLMTGTYPPYHGLRDNGLFRLIPEAVTVAELATEAGLETAAFVSAFVLDHQFGLDQGFGTYDDRFQVGYGGTLGVEERDASAVTDAALSWLRQHRSSRFFVWVHYFDPHQPLHAPEPYASLAPDPYHAEVLYVDSQVGRLLDDLHEADLEKGTTVIVVGDHGESLGEHGEETHGIFIYESTSAIPLIVRGPHLPLSKRVTARVSIVDLAPTIVSLLGIARPPSMQGRDLIGQITGEDSLQSRPLYLETYLTLFTYGWAPLHGLIDQDLKYIDAPRPELYDLATDPDEQDNLIDRRSADARRMARNLAALREQISGTGGVAWSADSDLSDESREMLSQLGYMSATGGGQATGIDPKDGIEESRLADRAAQLQRQGRFGEAVTLYERILARNPDNRWVLQHLGTALVGAGRDREAIEYLERAIKVRRIIGPPLFNLAIAYGRTGRDAEALALIEEIRTKNPKFAPAHQWLGRYQEKHRQWRAAIAAYRTFLKYWQGSRSMREQIEAEIRSLEKKL